MGLFYLALKLPVVSSRSFGVCHVTRKKPPKRAREILAYFVRNPEAADTLEGVARWRLLRETGHRSVAETAKALDWLVAEGFMKDSSTTYSKPIYSLNKNSIHKAELLLGQDQSPEDRD